MSIKQNNNKSIYENSAIKHKETVNSQEWKESIGLEQSRKHKETVNSQEWKETVGKEAKRKELKTKEENDSNRLGGIKCSITMNLPEWKASVGITKSLNMKKTLSIVQSNNKTLAQNRGEILSKILENKSVLKFGKFNVYKNNTLIHSNLLRKTVMKISASLIKSSKEKPLGSSNQSIAALKRANNLHLVGYYIVNINNNNTPDTVNNTVNVFDDISTVDLIEKLKTVNKS